MKKDELLHVLSDSIPVWSYFLGGAFCAVIGVGLFILPDILQIYGAKVDIYRTILLYGAGIFWFVCGTFLSIIYPAREVFRIAKTVKALFRKSDSLVQKEDCDHCQSLLFLKDEELAILNSELESFKRNQNKN